jgi:phage/plasmid primase-like uncharacterized protein
MNDYKINAKAVKEQARGRWLEILPLLDARLADAVARAGKHVPCPMHGGKDGFRLYADDQNGGGACNTCGTFADGFAVLQWLRGCSFYESLQLVAELLNNGTVPTSTSNAPTRTEPTSERGNGYMGAMKYLLDTSSRTPNRAARAYYERRGIAQTSEFITNSLKYHDSADVYHEGQRVVINGKPLRYPCILGLARNARGVTGLHQIYITKDGEQAATEISQIVGSEYSKKRMIGQFTGTAVRLAKAGKTLIVCEGIETALAIRLLTGSSSIAACGTAALLGSVDVPDCVENLLIYADNDAAGMAAAEKLQAREQQNRNVEIIAPDACVGNDWLDWLNYWGIETAVKKFR